MLAIVRAQLSASLNAKLVDELLAAHAEAKRNFYLGGLRLSEVEGGRFCEAALRILESITTRTFTPLGTELKSDRLISQLAQLPRAAFPDAIRLHIPRAIRLVYDIRNNRDAAHLADGIDPNLQDATVVSAVLDWILAEFIRLYHNVSADEASRIVDEIIVRVAPIVQDFDGYLKVLKPDLGAADHCLVLLYQRGRLGATFDELSTWARPRMRQNLRRTLLRLVTEKDFVHFDSVRYYITLLGQRDVEQRRLVQPNA